MYFFWLENTFIQKPIAIFLFTCQAIYMVITEPRYMTSMKYFFVLIWYNVALQVKPYNNSLQIKMETALFFNI